LAVLAKAAVYLCTSG